ncbi:MAG: TrkA family potassium uptake protein [Clostridia bacterium]|nr:TrkA family potassium uptake protein [Clostridia bacterium]
MRQFAVIGLGRFGASIAGTLHRMGYEVLAVDEDEDRVQEIMDQVTHAVQADALDEEVLKTLGLRNFDLVIVAIGQDIQASILVTVMLKDLGVKSVVAKAQNDLHGRVLERVGADQVIYPERDMAVRVAQHLVSGNVLDYIELSPEYSILEMVTPDEFAGKALGNIDLRNRHRVSVMAIKRGEDIIVAPGGQEIIQAKDVLVVIGANEDLKNLRRERD